MIFHRFAVVAALCAVFAVNGEEEKGCKTTDGKEVKVGEQYDYPGHCNLNKCTGNDEWLVASCGLVGVPQGWSSTPEDPSKGYPDCCTKLIPPLEIVPDLLDTAPGQQYLDITYSDNVTVDMGKELTPTQVKAEPSVTYSWADPESKYLIIMADPDAPSRQNPESREFVHWMVGNIPGSDVKSGEVIAEYIGSGPSKNTGLHRYFFLLYKQPGKLTFDEPKVNNTSIEWRRKFSTRKFAHKYGLEEPLAVNVFQAQYDDYVPKVHAQLGFSDPPASD